MKLFSGTTSLIIFFLFFSSSQTVSQFDLKLNLESGIYSDSVRNFENNVSLMNRAAGFLKYSYLHDSSESSILIRAGTDFYKSSVYTFKLNTNGNYLYQTKNVTWKGLLNYNYNSYNYNSVFSSFNIFTLIGGADFQFGGFPVGLFLGYSNQNLELQKNVYYDLIFIDLSTLNSFSNFFSLEYGFLVQNFSVNDELSSNNNISINGWNFGPQIKITNYKNILLNLNYKFLFYSSNSTLYPSFEHQLEFIAGTYISENLSLFLFVDYILRNLKFTNSFNKESSVFFIPSKSENQIALRFMYSMNTNFKPYLKLSYFNDDLFVKDYKFRGLNLLIGMEARINH